MSKVLGRYVHEGTLRMSDEDIRRECGESIEILYGFNNYSCNIVHINELKTQILKDYPDTKDEDIEVWCIKEPESIRHARFTMLRTTIPVEDFLRLRQENQIHIL